jgi:hypothetical protein
MSSDSKNKRAIRKYLKKIHSEEILLDDLDLNKHAKAVGYIPLSKFNYIKKFSPDEALDYYTKDESVAKIITRTDTVIKSGAFVVFNKKRIIEIYDKNKNIMLRLNICRDVDSIIKFLFKEWYDDPDILELIWKFYGIA